MAKICTGRKSSDDRCNGKGSSCLGEEEVDLVEEEGRWREGWVECHVSAAQSTVRLLDSWSFPSGPALFRN